MVRHRRRSRQIDSRPDVGDSARSAGHAGKGPGTCLCRARWAVSAAMHTAIPRLCGTTIVLLTFSTNVHIFDGFNMVLLPMFMRMSPPSSR